MPRRPRPSSPKQNPIHPFDQRHDTDTGGLIPAASLVTGHANDRHMTAYYGVAPSILDACIDRWLRTAPAPITRTTFLDIGAGKGRALLTASLHPFVQVTGVELNPALATIARNNIAKFHGTATPLSPVDIIEEDALAAPLPAGPALAFLFHPFEAPVLRHLLARFEQAYAPGQMELLYVNAEHASVLDGHPAFRQIFAEEVPMSAEDYLADLAEIATQQEYGSTGTEHCALYRLVGRA